MAEWEMAMKKKNQPWWWLMCVVLVLPACATTTPSAYSIKEDKNLDIVEHAMHEKTATHVESGSLWNNTGATMFTDPKAHEVGDLVTVLVAENASATRNLGTKSSRQSAHKTGVTASMGISAQITAKNPTFTPSTGIDVSDGGSYKGSGQTTNSDNLTASVTSVVTEVFPNGNMRIMGRRQVTINQQPQELTFTGVIRGNDIASDNTIPSAKVAQAVISYGGGGELASVTHKGWLSQTLDAIWPF